MKISEFIKGIEAVNCGSLEALELLKGENLWERSELSVFRIASRLYKMNRFEDVLNLIQIAESKGFHFEDERARSIQYLKGDVLLELRRFDDAISVYNVIVGLIPDAVAYCNLGLALWEKGEFLGALNNYRNSVSLNEMDPISLRGAGEMLNKLERYEEAIPYLIAAVNLDNKYVPALRALGIAYFNCGYWDGARNALERVILIDPGDSIARLGLSKLNGESEKVDK